MGVNALLKTARGIKYLRKLYRKFGGKDIQGNIERLNRAIRRAKIEQDKIRKKKLHTREYYGLQSHIMELENARNLLSAINNSEDHVREAMKGIHKNKADKTIPKEMKPYENSWYYQELDSVGEHYFFKMKDKNFLGNYLTDRFTPLEEPKKTSRPGRDSSNLFDDVF